MPLKLTYSNDAFEKGHEFDIQGLGIVENGKARTLTEEDERNFILANHATVKDSLKDSELISIDGTVSLSGGVKSVLGVDPADISDTFTPEDEVIVVEDDSTSHAVPASEVDKP